MRVMEDLIGNTAARLTTKCAMLRHRENNQSNLPVMRFFNNGIGDCAQPDRRGNGCLRGALLAPTPGIGPPHMLLHYAALIESSGNSADIVFKRGCKRLQNN